MGRIRAGVLPRVWGSEVCGVMRAVKDALNPRGLLNPGVMFSSAEWWEAWGRPRGVRASQSDSWPHV